jgi:hypothetical protein
VKRLTSSRSSIWYGRPLMNCPSRQEARAKRMCAHFSPACSSQFNLEPLAADACTSFFLTALPGRRTRHWHWITCHERKDTRVVAAKWLLSEKCQEGTPGRISPDKLRVTSTGRKTPGLRETITRTFNKSDSPNTTAYQLLTSHLDCRPHLFPLPGVPSWLIFYTMSAEVVHSRLVAVLKTA